MATLCISLDMTQSSPLRFFSVWTLVNGSSGVATTSTRQKSTTVRARRSETYLEAACSDFLLPSIYLVYQAV